MMASMAAFTLNDTLMKMMAGSVPLYQLLFLRGVMTTSVVSVIAWRMGAFPVRVARRDGALLFLRSLADTATAFFFLTALFNMPIANVRAILQVLPLRVSLAAALIVGEALGWRRLTAIFVGFVGVLLIIQPGGADFSSYSIYALGAVTCATVRDIATRRMSAEVPSVFVALIAAIGVMMLGAVGSLFTPWQPFTATSAGQLAGATTFMIFAYIASASAMRFGEIGFVAPFRYTSLLVALILGVLIFDEWPNTLALIGGGIVVATGLFTLYRETQLKIRHRYVSDRIK